jgi:uncharacterized membrane protein SpoIIM required for sporulation
MSTARPDTPEPSWHATLSSLAEQAHRRGLRSLSADEVLELNRLYRRLAAELARVRRDAPGSQRSRTLNAFAARVHGVIYQRRRAPADAFARFFAVTFPVSLAGHLGPIALSVAVFLVGSVFSYAFVHVYPQKAHYLVPPTFIENAEQGFRQESFQESTRRWQQKPLYVSFYITNNVKVAFMAFAVGIAFAVPTVIILFQNGIIMGATTAIVARNGLLGNLLGFISPHGPLELGAIFFSATAGMLLGWALIRPGRRTRRESLRAAAHDVIVLVIGSAVLLVLAAFLETFVAPLPVPNPVKWAIGAVNATLLVLYVLYGARLRRRRAA